MSKTERKTSARSTREALADAWRKQSQELLDTIHDQASEEELEEALSAPTSVSGLTSLLARYVTEVEAFDPLAPFLLDEVQAKAELLDEAGGALSRSEAAELLGITGAAVDQRRRRNRLLFVESMARSYQYPACQFTKEGPLPHLTELLDAFQMEDGWMRLDMLLSENTALGGKTPFEVLRSEPDEDELSNLLDVIGSWGG